MYIEQICQGRDKKQKHRLRSPPYLSIIIIVTCMFLCHNLAAVVCVRFRLFPSFCSGSIIAVASSSGRSAQIIELETVVANGAGLHVFQITRSLLKMGLLYVRFHLRKNRECARIVIIVHIDPMNPR